MINDKILDLCMFLYCMYYIMKYYYKKGRNERDTC